LIEDSTLQDPWSAKWLKIGKVSTKSVVEKKPEPIKTVNGVMEIEDDADALVMCDGATNETLVKKRLAKEAMGS
jgi:hypothetical protein